jgi:hypothetical protein
MPDPTPPATDDEIRRTEWSLENMKTLYPESERTLTIREGLALISHIRALQPVPVSERLPTREDGDCDGFVLVWFTDRSSGTRSWSNVAMFGSHVTHWCRIPALPKETRP